MSKTVIYFFRHGEVANPKNILYGRLPRFPLSVEGQRKIRKVAKQFKNKGIKHLYTSPMLRTIQTVGILAEELKLKPKISNLINEVKLIFAGMPLGIFRVQFQPTLYSRDNVARGQESVEAIAGRMFKFLRIIKKRHKRKIILVVSHGDPIVILKAKTQGVDFTNQYKKANYLKTGEYFTLICDDDSYSWK